ncbi:MAG TPA: hypothetical protein VMT35_00640 [Ignavibacteriaceae bacterium]|nr:hypothetical protein [Ignavibacteriaceae bacterium]
MIGSLKEKAAQLFVKWQVKELEPVYQSFTGFFTKSFNFLVLMPHDETDFHYSLEVVKFLEEKEKVPHIFTYDFRISLIPMKLRHHIIDYNLSDINKLKLPSRRLIEKLSTMYYNAVFDLNIKENLFGSYVCSFVNSPIKVGFQKPDSDKYYNLQIINRAERPEISYKNFLNCLRMF